MPAPSQQLPMLQTKTSTWQRIGTDGDAIGFWRLTEASPYGAPLVYYPEVPPGMTIQFYSPTFNEYILLDGFDSMRRCPAKHWWPYCNYCQKFLFPAGMHRASRSHEKALWKFIEFDLKTLRMQFPTLNI